MALLFANSHSRRARRGAIAVLTAVFLIVVMAMVAFAVDIGILCTGRTELQRCADAAAHAAVLEYRNNSDSTTVIAEVRRVAGENVESNEVLNKSASVSFLSPRLIMENRIISANMSRCDLKGLRRHWKLDESLQAD
jgi:Flp pilus assembly protein TadG